MYIIKNALMNLVRNKGRNGLIGIIVLAMISTIAISITINTTTNEVINSYKSRFGAEVTIVPNIEKLRLEIRNNSDDSDNIETITTKQNIKFSKSEHVKESKMELSIQGIARNIKGVGEDEYKKKMQSSNIPQEQVIGGLSSTNTVLNVWVKSFTENNMPKDFKNGLINITSGNMYKNKGEVIIGEELAKINNLGIGDEIKVEDPYEKGKILILKISGIFKDLRKIEPGYLTSQDSRNEIYTSFETMAEYDEQFDAKGSPMLGTATFYLKSPELLDVFTKELRENGLSDKFDVTTDEYGYNRVVAPVNGLKKVSTMFMIGIMVFGSIVLVLLSILSIRERKYEIGVLRAMGMSKIKLAAGFVFESIAIIAICLTLGLGIGAVSAQPTSDILLKEQVAVAKKQSTQSNQIMIMGYEEEDESVKTLETLEVNLTPQATIQVAGFALVLGLITSSIAVIYATKYEPIKILQERN